MNTCIFILINQKWKAQNLIHDLDSVIASIYHDDDDYAKHVSKTLTASNGYLQIILQCCYIARYEYAK